MGKWDNTQAAYFDKEEKVIPERDRLCMAQAMRILHKVREHIEDDSCCAHALDGAFKFIDKAVRISVHGADKGSLITQNDMAELAQDMVHIRDMRDWLLDGGLSRESFDVFIQWIDDAAMYIRYTGRIGSDYGNEEVSE